MNYYGNNVIKVVEDSTKQEIVDWAYEAGQGHVFRFWDELSQDQREGLLDQLASIDLEFLNRLINECIFYPVREKTHEFSPAPFIRIPKTNEESLRREEARELGEEALRKRKVACFLVAGGQSTRLGYDSPKGTFPIGPVTKKSLYQLHAEKILALRRRYKTKIPWYIMTSPSTDVATKDFFKQHNFFGLSREDVRFIVQGMLPSVDFEGKLLMDAKDHIVMSPNGHGGTIKALKESGVLGQMVEEGIEQIFYFQVDNPLIKIADPVFLGYHLKEDADMSFKVVQKRDPLEKVGVVGYIDDRLGVIEYSELPISLAEQKNPDGTLRFRAGSIAIHILKVDFMKRKDFNLPCHAAKKRIAFIDEGEILYRPDEPNGIKFETFIFDALSLAERSVIMEVVRSEEFSPLKNQKGPSSPEVVKQNMINLYANWLEEAGIGITRDSLGRIKGVIEVNPLYALDKEELIKKIDKNIVFDEELYLGEDGKAPNHKHQITNKS